MAYKRREDPEHIRAAGDRVEVIDANHSSFGKFGIVAFFVHDNIYVRFPGPFWARTKMFFPEQLQRSFAPQTRPVFGPATVLHKLRASLQRMRL